VFCFLNFFIIIFHEDSYAGLQKRIGQFSLFKGNDERLEVFEAQGASEKIYRSYCYNCPALESCHLEGPCEDFELNMLASRL